jgi:ABC-type branched-subunit amino acid transport system substrate-binding protein
VGIPLVTLTPAREHVGGDVFRLFLREEEEVDGLVRFAVTARNMRRFALLVPDTDAGRRYRALFWDAAVRHGAEIVASESFAPADTNLEIPLKRMTGIYNLTDAERRERFDIEREDAALRLAEKGEGPGGAPRELPERLQSFAKFKPRPIVDFDGLFLPVSGMTAAQLAPQLPYNDITGVTLLGSRSWNYESFVKVGEQYVENALFPAEWHESTPEGGAFAEAFVSAYGDPPGTMEAYAFDAVRLFTAALAAGQADERAAVARYLSRLAAVPAVTGPLSSLPGGDIAVEPKILTASHRRIVAATPLPSNGVKETP